MQCIVVRKDLPAMPPNLLHEVLAIIMSFSGIHVGGEAMWSASSIKKHFDLEEWGGGGMADAFRRLIRTTVSLQPEVESWVHEHFRTIPEYVKEPEYPDYWKHWSGI